MNKRNAPTRFDRRFHLNKVEYSEHSLERGLSEGVITREDAALITEFVTEIKSTRGVSDGRVNKLTSALVTWRRHLPLPYRENTIGDIFQAVTRLNSTIYRGRPYRQNTRHDFIKFLKRFYLWLIENSYSDVPAVKINKIRPPPVDVMTKTASQLLTEQEILAMINACMTSRDRAIISCLYEGGFRIQELATLTWSQVKFDDWGIMVNIDDKKTNQHRYIRLIMSREYLSAWRKDYPFKSEGESLVFHTSRYQPLQYGGISKQLREIAQRAGIVKHITPHIFRTSRITHLIRQGYSESIIKLMMWGNITTDMFKTYAYLTNEDIDNEVLERQGIKRNVSKSEPVMVPLQCSRCQTINSPASHYCCTCGRPLDASTLSTQEELMRFIDSHPELVEMCQRGATTRAVSV